MVAVEQAGGRLIKPHRKSRTGCGNCKLRRVKCDESKPICKRCKASSYLCNYGGNNAALEIVANGLSRLEAFDVVSFSLKSEGVDRYMFQENDLELLSKFRNRTTLTISTERVRDVYQNQIVEIAPYHPFLMHSLLALTMMHDRHIQETGNTQPTTETFHQYQSIALFNARLGKSVQPSPAESAALWVTAIIQGTMSFCRVEGRTPEDAWPLKPPSSSDLSWMTMSKGKMQLWKMTQPFTTETRFDGLVPPSTKGIIPKSSTSCELSVLPSDLVNICGLDQVANDSNPYHAVAATFAKSLNADYVSAVLSFLVLINNIPQEYKLLLKQKEPAALLLLSCWYAKLCEVELWWIRPRALLEGHAICIYLRRYHQDDARLQNVMHEIWQGMRDKILRPENYGQVKMQEFESYLQKILLKN